jgi:5'-methylthioinosine phosphorylase
LILVSDIAFAVIGGTGLYQLAALDNVETHDADTRYGKPSAPVRVGQLAGKKIAFMARHGEGHSVPPHKINYRANLQCLKDLGITKILAVNAVGGITDAFGPRVVAVPDQIIDYTYGRIHTLSEEPGTEVLHVDFTEPYCAKLRARILSAVEVVSMPIVRTGCYGATQGPRLETRAEIARMRRDGCDLVGMTGMPEAGLARELGLDYACLAIVANWAAGCGDGAEITLDEVLANVNIATAMLPALLAEIVRQA